MRKEIVISAINPFIFERDVETDLEIHPGADR